MSINRQELIYPACEHAGNEMDIYFIYFYFISLGPETYVAGIVRLKKRIENS